MWPPLPRLGSKVAPRRRSFLCNSLLVTHIVIHLCVTTGPGQFRICVKLFVSAERPISARGAQRVERAMMSETGSKRIHSKPWKFR